MTVKILIITNASDNIRTHRLTFLKCLADQGYRVHVAVPETSETLKEFDFFRCHTIRLSRGGMNPFEDLRTCMDIYKLIKKIRPDVIHNFTIKPVLYGTLTGLLNPGVKIINTITGLGVMFQRKSFMRVVVEQSYRFIGASRRVTFVVQNKFEKRILERFVTDPKRLYLIPGSGVDLEKFHPDPAITVIPNRILFPARMLYDKGAQDLVEAHRLLKNRGLVIDLRFVGGLDMNNPAAIPENQLLKWEEEGWITWKGASSDMVNEYNAAAIVCLPSYHEGLPKVLLEAGACARPVIGTDIPGIRELIATPELGLTVPVNNPERLAQAIELYLGNTRLADQHATALYNEIVRSHDTKLINKSYRDVYDHVKGII